MYKDGCSSSIFRRNMAFNSCLFSFSAPDKIDPYFHTCKKFIHAKAFVQEATASFSNGQLVYVPTYSPMNMDRTKQTVKNYYRIHEFEPNLNYLYDHRQAIDKKYKMVTRLQDAFYAVAMHALAKRFEAVHEKYKSVLGASAEAKVHDGIKSDDTATAS